jgi:predicted MPP superfamily phosphohydrolase
VDTRTPPRPNDPQDRDAVLQRMFADRMGPERCAKRLATERAREKEYHNPVGSRLTFLKRRLFRPIEIAALKLCGLYRRGHRNSLDFQAKRLDLPLEGLPAAFDGFTLLHLSDLHIDLHPGIAPAIAEFTSTLAYDACVITGDFRNLTVGPWKAAAQGALTVLRVLRAPVHAVLGNHDTLNLVDVLEQAGARFLLNECACIRREDATLALLGIDDPNIYQTDDLPRALAAMPSGAFPVLLSHSPCIYRRAEAAGVRLLLAGHTHGGQICLPGGRPILDNDPTPRPFQRGLWSYRSLVGYTSVGIGTCGIPVRFHCPPEAALLTLRAR